MNFIFNAKVVTTYIFLMFTPNKNVKNNSNYLMNENTYHIKKDGKKYQSCNTPTNPLSSIRGR